MIRGLAFTVAMLLGLALYLFSQWRNEVQAHADAERDFAECSATITAMIEGQEIDDAIPDDLNGFDIPDAWRVPLDE